jgi:hypothetical protein
MNVTLHRTHKTLSDFGIGVNEEPKKFRVGKSHKGDVKKAAAARLSQGRLRERRPGQSRSSQTTKFRNHGRQELSQKRGDTTTVDSIREIGTQMHDPPEPTLSGRSGHHAGTSVTPDTRQSRTGDLRTSAQGHAGMVSTSHSPHVHGATGTARGPVGDPARHQACKASLPS